MTAELCHGTDMVIVLAAFKCADTACGISRMKPGNGRITPALHLRGGLTRRIISHPRQLPIAAAAPTAPPPQSVEPPQ